MNILPQARNEEIVVQHLNDETLIYDLRTNKAVCLNSTSAIVYSHCDSTTTFDALKSRYKFNDDLIYLTLDKLNENNLLENYSNSYFSGLSRREVIKRVGMGSMIALPVIAGLVAPSAAFAASGGLAPGAACTDSPPLNTQGSDPQCASSNCYTVRSNGGNANVAATNGTQPKCCTSTAGNNFDTGHNLNNGNCALFGTACCKGSASAGGTTVGGNPSCLCN